MCGKFTQMMSWARLHHLAELTTSSGGGVDDGVQMRTPMRFASVIRLGANGQRETVAMRWGFADSLARRSGAPAKLRNRACSDRM
jgi:putative SOS response-associated peptidase YedK